MSAATYTIHYRSALHPDSMRLVVEDVSGEYHLFTCHPDHCSLHPMPAEERNKADLLRLGWHPVSGAVPLSFDTLRSLITGALITHHLPPLLDHPVADEAKARRSTGR
jgi:hypothetical protein